MGFLVFKTMSLLTAFQRDNRALNPGNKPATNWHQALGSSGHHSDELPSLCSVTPCYQNVCCDRGVRRGSACCERAGDEGNQVSENLNVSDFI